MIEQELSRVEAEAFRHPPSATEALELEFRVSRDPESLPDRIRLFSFLVSDAVQRGFAYESSRLAPHIVRFVRDAPYLRMTMSTGIVHPADAAHRELEEAWSDALTRFPDNAAVFENAVHFLYDWDLVGAASVAGRALELEPGDATIQLVAGHVNLTGADLRVAECSYAMAAIHFDNARVLSSRDKHLSPGFGSVAAFDAGMKNLARALAEEAVEQPGFGFDDNLHLGWTTLGRLAFSEGRIEEAHDCLRLSIERYLSYGGPSLRLAGDLARAGSVEIVAGFLRDILQRWFTPTAEYGEWIKALHEGAFEKLINPGR